MKKLFPENFAFFAKNIFLQPFRFIFAFCSHAKNAKISRKNNAKILRKKWLNTCVLWTDRQKLKMIAVKSTSLHQTFIKVKEEELYIMT